MDPMSSVEDTKLHQSTSEIPQKVVSRFGFLQLSERSSATAETQSQQNQSKSVDSLSSGSTGFARPMPFETLWACDPRSSLFGSDARLHVGP